MEQLCFSVSVIPNLSALHFCIFLKHDCSDLAMPGVSLICGVFLHVTAIKLLKQNCLDDVLQLCVQIKPHALSALQALVLFFLLFFLPFYLARDHLIILYGAGSCANAQEYSANPLI